MRKWIWSSRKHPAELSFWTLTNYYSGKKDCGLNWIFPLQVPDEETFFGTILEMKDGAFNKMEAMEESA